MEQLKKFFMILCLSALVIVNGGCSKDKPNNIIDPDKIDENGDGRGWEFLKVGNKWEYKSTTDIVEYPQYIWTDEIEKIKKSFDYPNTDKIALEEHHYWYVTDNAFYIDGWNIYNDFPLIYKNCKVGQTWYYKFNNEIGLNNKIEDKITRTVLSINELVEVPAGTFDNCVKIRETVSRNNKIYIDYYFSYKYGLIKKDDNWDDERNIDELISKNFQ